jgi:hypothetical protein
MLYPLRYAQVFRANGTRVVAGDHITSRLGRRYMFRYATVAATDTAFGRIVAAPIMSDGFPLGHNDEFTDFAFGLTVR